MSVAYVTSQTILLEETLPEIAECDKLGFDVECRGTNPREDMLLTVQFSNGDTDWVIDVQQVNLEPLLDVLTQTNPLLIGHNLKFDLAFMLNKYGFRPDRLYDTMVAFWILNNGLESPYVSLNDLTISMLDVALNKDIRSTFATTYGPLSESQIEYAAADVHYMTTIMDRQVSKLKRDDLIRTAKLEFSVLPVVVELENNGILLDQEHWTEAAQTLTLEAKALEAKICEIAGASPLQDSFFGDTIYDLNPRSPAQMLKLFNNLGFSIQDTRANTLDKIDHELATALLSYRKKQKLASTYGTNFLSLIGKDGRIHANYNQVGTVTGRFSSSGPNLQNIPDTEMHRGCFIADEGYMMLTADFSQIELKIAAVMSNEPEMLAEYMKPDADLHALTGTKLFHVSLEELQHWQRKIGKHCNFGILYGISEYGLRRKWGIPIADGKKYISGFRKSYPVLAAFMDGQSDYAMYHGYNTTLVGRRRYYRIPATSAPTYMKDVSRIRREASNNPIQGSAADIMKQSLRNLYLALRGTGVKLVNTVHDEVVLETPVEKVSTTIPIVHSCLEKAASSLAGDELEWKISLAVGKSWKKA